MFTVYASRAFRIGESTAKGAYKEKYLAQQTFLLTRIVLTSTTVGSTGETGWESEYWFPSKRVLADGEFLIPLFIGKFMKG